MKHKDKPIHLKIIASLSSLVLICTCIYVAFAGIGFVSGAVLFVAFASLGGPVAAGGGSFMEVVAGIFEAFIQGIASIGEAIGSALSF